MAQPPRIRVSIFYCRTFITLHVFLLSRKGKLRASIRDMSFIQNDLFALSLWLVMSLHLAEFLAHKILDNCLVIGCLRSHGYLATDPRLKLIFICVCVCFPHYFVVPPLHTIYRKAHHLLFPG